MSGERVSEERLKELERALRLATEALPPDCEIRADLNAGSSGLVYDDIEEDRTVDVANCVSEAVAIAAAEAINALPALISDLRSARARVAALEGEVERLRGGREKKAPGLPRCPDCGLPAPEGAHTMIIVNGEGVAVPVAVGESLSHARARALERTKNTGRPQEEWEIRSAKGRLLDPWARLAHEHYRGRHLLVDGDIRLFLTLRVGFGGSK